MQSIKSVKYHCYHYSDPGSLTSQIFHCFFLQTTRVAGTSVFVFVSGSDSEGNEEPVVGNVNKFCVVPPGFTGRPRRGHLIFDACFESGTVHLSKYFQ